MKINDPPVSDRYTALNKVVEVLSSSDDISKDKQAWVRMELASFTESEIHRFLDESFPREQVLLRRKLHRVTAVAIGTVAYFLAVILLVVFHKQLLPYVGLANIPLGIAYCVILFWASNKSRLGGLAKMVSKYGGGQQVPLMIDALYFDYSRPFLKRRLAELLPLYSQSDVLPLDKYQAERLVKELKRGFRQMIRAKKSPSEDDFSFWVAILIFFERELAQGRPVPKDVLPVLNRFATTAPTSQMPETKWHLLKSTAEECLAYVGAKKVR